MLCMICTFGMFPICLINNIFEWPSTCRASIKYAFKRNCWNKYRGLGGDCFFCTELGMYMHHCLHTCARARCPFICSQIKCVQHINKCNLHAAWQSQLLITLQLCHIVIRTSCKKQHSRACISRWCEMITATWIPSSPPSVLCLVFVHGRDISHNTETCPWPLLSASKSAPSLNRLWELCSATRCRWLFIFEECNKVGNFIGRWSLLGWNWVFWTWPSRPLFLTVISFCRCDMFCANEMHVRRCLLLALRDGDDCYWVTGLVLAEYMGIMCHPLSSVCRLARLTA